MTRTPSQEAAGAAPFLASLGVTTEPLNDGRSCVRLRIDNHHLRTRGIAHGGVIASILDTAMGMAAGHHTPEGRFPVTAQLDTRFIRPAWEGEELTATAEVCHHGQQTAVTRGEVRTETGVLVATGSATFIFVVDPAPTEDRLPRRPD